MDGAEPILVPEIGVVVDLPVKIGVKTGVWINVPAMRTGRLKVVKDLARTGEGRTVGPAPRGSPAGVGDRSPGRCRADRGFRPKKRIVHEGVLERLPPTCSGHDGDGEDGVEILAVDGVEAALFKGAESGEAGLRERARCESEKSEIENDGCPAHVGSLLNWKIRIGEAGVEGDGGDGDRGPRRAIEREVDLRGVGGAGSSLVAREEGVNGDAGSRAAPVAANERNPLRKVGAGVEPHVKDGEAGERLKRGLRRESVLDADVLEELLAAGFESDVLYGVVGIGEGGGEEWKREADGLTGGGAFERNAGGGGVDGFVGEALGVDHGVRGARKSGLLGGLVGAASEDLDGAVGCERAGDNGDVACGDGVRGDRSAHGIHGSLQKGDGLRIALDEGSGLLRRRLGEKQE
jgi:hypothetical protein